MSTLRSEAYLQLVARLARARSDAGLTQRELGRSLDVDHTFIAKYESGRVRLDVIQFLKIAAVLKLDPAETLRGLPDLAGTRMVATRAREPSSNSAPDIRKSKNEPPRSI